MVIPVLWRGVKAVGLETLCTGGKILTDIADNSLIRCQTRRNCRKTLLQIRAEYNSEVTRTRSQMNHCKIVEEQNYKRETSLKEGRAYKKGYLFLKPISPYPTMPAENVSVSTEFDIFAERPVQMSTLDSIGGSERYWIFYTRSSWYIYRSKYSSIYLR